MTSLVIKISKLGRVGMNVKKMNYMSPMLPSQESNLPAGNRETSIFAHDSRFERSDLDTEAGGGVELQQSDACYVSARLDASGPHWIPIYQNLSASAERSVDPLMKSKGFGNEGHVFCRYFNEYEEWYQLN